MSKDKDKKLADLIYSEFNVEHLLKLGEKFTDHSMEYQLEYLNTYHDGKNMRIEESEEYGSIRWKKPMDDTDGYNIENFDIFDMLVQLPDNCIDLVLMDLPYGTTSNKWDVLIPTEPLFLELNRILKPTGNIILTSNTWFTMELGYHAHKMKMFTNKLTWIKNKNNSGTLAKIQPLRQTEDILVLKKKGSKASERTYNPLSQESEGMRLEQIEKLRTLNGSKDKIHPQRTKDKIKGYPRDVLMFDKAGVVDNPWDSGEFGRNNTQKPVDLLMYLIYLYSNPGEIVFDGTMGAGSSGVASMLSGRRFLGNEIQSSYFRIAHTRMAHTHEGIEKDIPTSELIKEDMMRYLNQK